MPEIREVTKEYGDLIDIQDIQAAIPLANMRGQTTDLYSMKYQPSTQSSRGFNPTL